MSFDAFTRYKLHRCEHAALLMAQSRGETDIGPYLDLAWATLPWADEPRPGSA